LNSKFIALADGRSKPIMPALTEGQLSYHTGAMLVCPVAPEELAKHRMAITLLMASLGGLKFEALRAGLRFLC
jgi:hypothetical protein